MTTRLDRRELQSTQKMSQANIEALLETEKQAGTSGINSALGLIQAFAASAGEPEMATFFQMLSMFKEDDFSSVSTSTAYTTTGLEDLVIATASLTVSLNASPDDGETVKVKRATTAGYVTVSGNGNTIDGDSTFTMVNNYGSFTFKYVEDAGEWLII